MVNFWDSVNGVIRQSDILILVLDARFIDETMNAEIMDKIKEKKKPYMYAITKTDIAGRIDTDSLPTPYVLVSPTQGSGRNRLRERILAIAERSYGKGSSVRVGVLGYPNVGKSSVINMLKGAKSASTSSMPGHTKMEQPVRADSRILLIDTPGVIPFLEKDPAKHAAIGSVHPGKLKDPELTLQELMERYPGTVEKYFGVEPGESPRETIERIALKKNLLLKGGVPDVQRAARMAISAIQKGKMKL